MKTFRILANGLAAVALVCSLTACSDDHDDPDVSSINIEDAGFSYNESGYWTKCYDVEQGDFTIGDLTFSHSASYMAEWDYRSWMGFCPSTSDDTAYYADDLYGHQWTAITGKGVKGENSAYLVGFCDVSTPDNANTSVTHKDGKYFFPQKAYVTNATVTYYAMKYGTGMTEPFGASDYLRLIIKGVSGSGFVGSVVVDLGKGETLLDTWKEVDLSGMGQVDALLFSMESSQSNEWGMLTPAYFCLGALSYIDE